MLNHIASFSYLQKEIFLGCPTIQCFNITCHSTTSELSSQFADDRTVQRVVGRERLTPVQVMTFGVWLLCLHDCYHPIYPATQHRQIWHHDWTTVHIFSPGSFPSTLPPVRPPAWITESWAWTPSHPRLEIIKVLQKHPFCTKSYSKYLSTIFLKDFQFSSFSETQFPGWVLLKTVSFWNSFIQPPAYISHICFSFLSLSSCFPSQLAGLLTNLQRACCYRLSVRGREQCL